MPPYGQSTTPEDAGSLTPKTDSSHHQRDDEGLGAQDANEKTSPPSAPAETPSSPGSPYLNNSASVADVRVDVDAPILERDAQIEAAVRQICPEVFACGDATTRSLTIRQLGGGLSNHLYVVASSHSEDAVLVRVHGEDDGGQEGEDEEFSFVDREVENRVLAVLSTAGLAPTFHGRFRNGRVEEFYDGYRPLSWEEMSDRRYAGGVAEAMAKLHSVEMPEAVLSSNSGGGAEGGDVWGRVEGWLQMARGDEDEDVCDSDGALDLKDMRNEWGWLKSELREPVANISEDRTAQSDAVAFFRQVVFAHMDCQSLNILTPSDHNARGDDYEEEDEAPVRLIDFEYAALNPRAVDIANTFCEHCDMNNLAADYDAQYPTAEQQDFFLRRYVSRADPDLALRLNGGGYGNGRAWDDFLSAARLEVGKHALVSHLEWAVWALAQQRRGGGGIDFDYGAYANLRMVGYWVFKGWFWPSLRRLGGRV